LFSEADLSENRDAPVGSSVAILPEKRVEKKPAASRLLARPPFYVNNFLFPLFSADERI